MRWSVASPLRIILLDDHALIREALEIRFSLEADFKVQGVYSTSRELLDSLNRAEADLVVLDYQLADADIDGLRLIQSVRRRHPSIRIVIYSSSEKPATVNMSLRAGANGFVGKSQPTDELLRAVRMVALDRIYLAPAMAAELEKIPAAQMLPEGDDPDHAFTLSDQPNLSPKESEVLRCCLEGMSVSQIASKFTRSRKTISGQKQAAFRKLGIKTDTELFKLQVQLKKS
ncbi:response regulator transcription factor [Pseudomonas fragi]|uniref:response regulator transcription factor n=1 Tax=Pseudomonas fragi TaxID=296 RepID=UPI001F2F8A1C|nr:response regulator transcription factor [Pseudomonas fragi]MCF6763244.1 response regulator transcription factor [Pseudomonas fragi]MCK6254641.1 response regulator transcription factor [Pseudomonas fragi]